MPIYDYRCGKCKKSFTLTLSFRDYERKKAKCPHCKSTQVERLFGAVGVKTSKKS